MHASQYVSKAMLGLFCNMMLYERLLANPATACAGLTTVALSGSVTEMKQWQLQTCNSHHSHCACAAECPPKKSLYYAVLNASEHGFPRLQECASLTE